MDELLLFSGGLDSLAGATSRAVEDGLKVGLVSHRSVSEVGSRQTVWSAKLGERAAVPPFRVSLWINKPGIKARDNNPRARSFLFASLACVCPRVFQLDRFYFYENGMTSVNLPIGEQTVGPRRLARLTPRL